MTTDCSLTKNKNKSHTSLQHKSCLCCCPGLGAGSGRSFFIGFVAALSVPGQGQALFVYPVKHAQTHKHAIFSQSHTQSTLLALWTLSQPCTFLAHSVLLMLLLAGHVCVFGVWKCVQWVWAVLTSRRIHRDLKKV